MYTDENPKIAKIQGPITRSRTKQSVDTLQQMVSDTINKVQVEKDEGLEAETLLKILRVMLGAPNTLCKKT